jgi:hypothetical protein
MEKYSTKNPKIEVLDSDVCTGEEKNDQKRKFTFVVAQ